jgi:CRP-like cAMP-binding protein
MRPGVEVLRALPLFAACASAVLTRINDIADLARLGPDEVLFRQNERLDELNILVSGYAVTTRSQPGSDDAAADVIEPVKPIGMAAALLGGPSPIGAHTVTSARVIVISAPELRTMIRKLPALGSSFLDYTLHDLQDLTRENCQLKLRTATQRLAEYLLSLIDDPEVSPARFVLPYEKRFLAAKLGCSQENLSRIFSSLRAIGVSSRAGIVVVREVALLRAYVGLTEPQPTAVK